PGRGQPATGPAARAGAGDLAARGARAALSHLRPARACRGLAGASALLRGLRPGWTGSAGIGPERRAAAQPPRISVSAIAHITSATPASSTRQATGRAKTGANSRAP